MNNVKVQTKLIIVMLTTIVALVLCAIISSESMKQLQSKALETLEADERASYDEQIKQQVDNVISLCQTIYDQYQAGVYTEEEAKKLAADEIRQLRYGDAGYFWVDQYDGTNVVLLGNDTEGTNRMETKRCQWIPDGKRDHPCRSGGRRRIHGLCIPERRRDRTFSEAFLQ